MSVASQASRRAAEGFEIQLRQHLDLTLLICVATLAGLGLVMLTSASISVADRDLGNAFYYLQRQSVFVGAGILVAAACYRIPLTLWEAGGFGLLMLTYVLLALVLLPGVGKTVNGSTRWLPLGVFSLQVSEVAKLFMTLYLAGYLVRRRQQIRESMWGFLKPVFLILLTSVLLLAEPDFGAAVLLTCIAMGMLFLGGARLGQFGMLLVLAGGAVAMLAVSSPYRLERITVFLNPWADPYNSGFQLTQSLIAIGSGSWFGVGLGASIQKLFYLPEAHNDFLFAVMAEELGLVGAIAVIALFGLFVWRAFAVGANAERRGVRFGAYLAYGIGIWVGLQAFINIGVNMGVLPTKGLTLPFMSSGGSSMLVLCAAFGLLLRVHRESAGASVIPPAGVGVRKNKKKKDERSRNQ
ncbi:MAG: putative lipid II flippase FtsW [Gammaproteobacteria bacterium]